MRSFTIEKVEKASGGIVRYTEGRFISETPSGAVKKMFTKLYHHLKSKGPLSLKITLRETTQSSKHKVYRYKVTRKAEKTEIQLSNGETITFNFTSNVKSLN